MIHVFPPRCAQRFAPQRLLATGGFGAVYLALQKDLDRQVAIKLLTSQALRDPKQVQRFLAEARITASLHHPHIVAIVDHDVEQGVPWIAYEYLTGRTLRDALLAGALEWHLAAQAAVQIASALEVVHSQGILHRDIKPENVIEQAEGHWKVTDFGIAKWTEAGRAKTEAGLLLGTPAYVSPEQVRGDDPGPATDQYALAVLLHELLTGHTPFESANPAVLMAMHLELSPPPVRERAPAAPRALESALLTALAKQPGERFPDLAAFRAALEDVLACEGRPYAATKLVATLEPARGPDRATAPRKNASMRKPAVAPARRPLLRPSLELRVRRHGPAAACLGLLLALVAAFSGSPRPAPLPVPTPAPVRSPAPRPAAGRASPADRDNAGAAWDPVNERVVLFGGAPQAARLRVANDLWSWDGAGWTRLDPPRPLPEARVRLAMASDTLRRRVVLFGGLATIGDADDTWEWDGARWHERPSALRPLGRSHHAMAYCPDRRVTYLCGGGDDSRLWEWDGAAWTPRALPGGPPPLADPALAYDERRKVLVLVGGRTIDGVVPQYRTYECDGVRWREVLPIGAPARLVGARAVYDSHRQRTLLYGSLKHPEVWEFDGARWTARAATPGPSPRYDHAMAFDRTRGVLVVFGGASATDRDTYGDTWEWDGTSWRLVAN